MHRSNKYPGKAALAAFALWIITIGTNPFGTSDGNVDECNWQLQVQPHDVTWTDSLRNGDFNVRLQRKELRSTRVA